MKTLDEKKRDTPWESCNCLWKMVDLHNQNQQTKGQSGMILYKVIFNKCFIFLEFCCSAQVLLYSVEAGTSSH